MYTQTCNRMNLCFSALLDAQSELLFSLTDKVGYSFFLHVGFFSIMFPLMLLLIFLYFLHHPVISLCLSSGSWIPNPGFLFFNDRCIFFFSVSNFCFLVLFIACCQLYCPVIPFFCILLSDFIFWFLPIFKSMGVMGSIALVVV